MGELTLKISILIASGLGSGRARFASGTWGSLAALFTWVILFKIGIINQIAEQLILILFTIGLGTITSNYCLAALIEGKIKISSSQNSHKQDTDPSFIVIDEWAGMFVTLLAIKDTTVPALISAFLLFRLLDILKPGPVGWAERLPRGYGVMFDDVVAGVLGYILLLGAMNFLPGLMNLFPL